MPATVIAEVPALPLHTAGKYVAGAYIVLFLLVLIYVAIMAIRLSRIERALGELLSISEQAAPPAPQPAAAAMQPAASAATLEAEPGAPRESTLAYPMEGQS